MTDKMTIYRHAAVKRLNVYKLLIKISWFIKNILETPFLCVGFKQLIRINYNLKIKKESNSLPLNFNYNSLFTVYLKLIE